MLKRSDLAKQFELVVKQEIKNYQDSLNFVLQSINELKQSIKEVSDKLSVDFAKLHSGQVDFKSEIDALNQASINLSLRFEKSLRDQCIVNERNELEMRDISSAFYTEISINNNFQDQIDKIWTKIYKMEIEANEKFTSLNQHADDLSRRFKKDLDRTKEEILTVPTEASLIKKELEEKIDCHKVDVAGIMKELNIYKKENYITQKKIENIYTLIERLREAP